MKILIFILGISIPLFALFIGLQISPTIGGILITPITFISSLLEHSFSELPYFIHALVIFAIAVFYLLFCFFSSKFLMEKFLSKV
jgi:hypothetical protein